MALVFITGGAFAGVLALYLADARQEIDVLATDLSMREVELENERAAHQETRVDRDSNVEALMQERIDHNEAVTLLARERNNFEESTAALNEEYSALDDKNKTLRSTVGSLERKNIKLTLANVSLTEERDGVNNDNASLNSDIANLNNDKNALIQERDGLNQELSVLRLAHESVATLEVLQEAEDAYVDLAVEYCGSVAALSSCNTTQGRLTLLQEAYDVYLEAQSQARDQYCAYKETYDSFYQSEPTSRYLAVCGGEE